MGQGFERRPSSQYSPVANRRDILKSAALMMGASALTNALPAFAASDSQNEPARNNGNSGVLRKGMIGFMLAHEQFPVPQLIQLGAAAEQAGFDLLATSDHLQPWQSNEGHSGEAWVTMAALGQRTQHIWMGPTVTCPTFRYNPAVVAEAFASLSLLYPGRIFLGLGSGEALNEQVATGEWPKWTERSERLIEASEIIRRLWTGEPVAHKGKYYAVNARLYDAPPKPIPLLMAANGPKAMQRAGKYADGLVTDPITWRQHKAEFVSAAKAAGKNPDEMPVLVEQYVVVGSQQDAQAAAHLWRFGPKAFKTYYNIPDPALIQQRATSEIPLEKVTAEWPIGTDPEPHVKTITELFQSGATIVNIHTGQANQQKAIEFYATEVIPRIKRNT